MVGKRSIDTWMDRLESTPGSVSADAPTKEEVAAYFQQRIDSDDPQSAREFFGQPPDWESWPGCDWGAGAKRVAEQRDDHEPDADPRGDSA